MGKGWKRLLFVGVVALALVNHSACARVHRPLTAKVGEEITDFILAECRDPGIRDLQAGLIKPGVVHITGRLHNDLTREEVKSCIMSIAGVTDVWDATQLEVSGGGGGGNP